VRDRLLLTGVTAALLGVGLGAFGAHALADRLTPADLATFETAVRYQMYHALALVGLGALRRGRPSRWFDRAGALFAVGIAIFSGSLYLLVLTGTRWLGAVTPLGGVAFLAGWALFATGLLREEEA
jgi:uncharacterized membrane protein YgdD (TMEM256/DUF423 family)